MPHNFKRKYLIMKTFIVGTENFVAKNIACKALAAFKAVNDNEITRGLHAKACMKGRKVTIKNEDGTETVKLHRRIVITSIEEMQAWNDAIHAYEADKTIKLWSLESLSPLQHVVLRSVLMLLQLLLQLHNNKSTNRQTVG